MMSNIHDPTIRSNCLESTAVSEIGLRSSSIFRGGVTLGMGITVDSFQSDGRRYPSAIEELKIAQMGGASNDEQSLSIQLGISSGAGVFTYVSAGEQSGY